MEVLRASRHRIGEYLPGYHQGQPVDTSFAGEGWQATLRDRRHPTRLRRRQFEVCVFAHLADELRSGDVAVAGSESYANLHTQLMSWAECQPLVAGYCAQAGIAATAEQAARRDFYPVWSSGQDRVPACGRFLYRLVSRFIPCGVWEAVYILDGLLANDSDIQPDAVHADT